MWRPLTPPEHRTDPQEEDPIKHGWLPEKPIWKTKERRAPGAALPPTQHASLARWTDVASVTGEAALQRSKRPVSPKRLFAVPSDAQHPWQGCVGDLQAPAQDQGSDTCGDGFLAAAACVPRLCLVTVNVLVLYTQPRQPRGCTTIVAFHGVLFTLALFLSPVNVLYWRPSMLCTVNTVK